MTCMRWIVLTHCSNSFRKGSHIVHYSISQLEAGKFVLAGEVKVHKSLALLVEHHMKVRCIQEERKLFNPSLFPSQYPTTDNVCLIQPCCHVGYYISNVTIYFEDFADMPVVMVGVSTSSTHIKSLAHHVHIYEWTLSSLPHLGTMHLSKIAG